MSIFSVAYIDRGKHVLGHVPKSVGELASDLGEDKLHAAYGMSSDLGSNLGHSLNSSVPCTVMAQMAS